MSEEKTRRYLIIKEDGTVEHHEMPFKKKWDLKELQDKVEGYIELIHFQINGRKYSGYSNEEYDRARRPLLPNDKATRYYHGYFTGKEEFNPSMVTVMGPVIVENFKGDHEAV